MYTLHYAFKKFHNTIYTLHFQYLTLYFITLYFQCYTIHYTTLHYTYTLHLPLFTLLYATLHYTTLNYTYALHPPLFSIHSTLRSTILILRRLAGIRTVEKVANVQCRGVERPEFKRAQVQ